MSGCEHLDSQDKTELISKEVGLISDEEFVLSEESRRTASHMGKKGKSDLIELLTQQKLDDSERSLRKSTKLKNKLRNSPKYNRNQPKLSIILFLLQKNHHNTTTFKKYADIMFF